MAPAKIYYVYMALVGIVSGTVLVLAPQSADAFIPPYFWVLIAVALFDVGVTLRGRVAPAAAIKMQTRIIGFVTGALLMAAIAYFAGSTVSFL